NYPATDESAYSHFAANSYPSTGDPTFQIGGADRPTSSNIGGVTQNGTTTSGFAAAPSDATTAPTASPAAQKAQSDSCLLGARKALAVGDVQRATAMAEQAKRLHTNYGPTDDSPARIDALIAKYRDLSAQSAHSNTDGYRHQYAALLMEESEGLLRWREFDESERLAADAKKLPVQYNPIESRPDTLLQRIAQERRGGGARSQPSASRLDLVGPGGTANSTLQVAPGSFDPSGKRQAQELTRQARAAIAQGDMNRAEQLARHADGLAPDTAFTPQEDRPSIVLLDIQKARLRVSAGGVMLAGGDGSMDPAGRHYASQSIYDPNNDPTRVVAAQDQEPVVRPLPVTPGTPEGMPDKTPPAVQLFLRGEKALADGNRDEAIRLFQQAYANPEQLDPATRQRLQDHLQMMSVPQPRPGTDNPLSAAAAHQQLLFRQMSADISRLQDTAQKMLQKEPKKSLEVLQKARTMVESSAELEPQAKQQLLRRVDESIHQTQQIIQANLAQIETDEHNRAVHDEVDNHRKMKIEISEKLAGMVDEYNKL
ncbi:MAG TPA: hypothetical protein VGH32_09145, partial [Pirellulales bacterium]